MKKDIERLAELGEETLSIEMDSAVSRIFDAVNSLPDFLLKEDVKRRNEYGLDEVLRRYIQNRTRFLSYGLAPSSYDGRVINALQALDYVGLFQEIVDRTKS